MKILLINPPIRLNEKPSNFPFGLGYIAAVLLREGYKVDVLDINWCRYNDKEIEKILRRKLIEDKIDVVGIGCLITCYSYVKWLIKTIKLNVRWVTSARVNLVDEPLLRKMKEAGCIAFNYGIESGSPRMLNIMRKGVTVEQASKAV